MGGTRWSDDHYVARKSLREKTGEPTFAYSAGTSSKPRSEHVAHKSLEPKGIKVRESRDTETCPESRAIAVLFDVTGSMRSVPSILQNNLPKLMGLLIRKGYVPHPQIMVGAIGDATCDRVPLQVGQFEGGIEIEDNLTNLFLEGRGGSHITESYELAMWFIANKTSIDCFDKRGDRGYLFLIGDEIPYPKAKRDEINSVIGDGPQEDVPVEQIVAQLKERWDVYYILPNMTANWDSPVVFDRWKKLLDQNALKLDNPEAISELIASTIGVCEKGDLDAVASDLEAEGSGSSVAAVRGALATLKPSSGGKLQNVDVSDSGADSGVATA